MIHVLAFATTLLHEWFWMAWISGISKRRLGRAMWGNAGILASGFFTVSLVANDLALLPAVVAGGVLATALFWRFNR